jgi:hypothetical protein
VILPVRCIPPSIYRGGLGIIVPAVVLFQSRLRTQDGQGQVNMLRRSAAGIGESVRTGKSSSTVRVAVRVGEYFAKSRVDGPECPELLR